MIKEKTFEEKDLLNLKIRRKLKRRNIQKKRNCSITAERWNLNKEASAMEYSKIKLILEKENKWKKKKRRK